ncbi:MAG: hypothetical protein IJA41_08260 [Clostridia bacterium]|nr:hypothetical protein [Clostridia bacterium]
MKVTQYITTANQNFNSVELKRAVRMSGALTVVPAEKPLNTSFKGFGVAITGASCYNLSELTNEARTALINDIYSPEGLDLSIARISVGSSDYSAELYSYDDVDGDVELKYFSIDRDKEYIIPMIKEILKVRPDLYIYSSPWSPPGWMKTGGSMCGGYMREEYVECYAEYYVKFLKAYEAEGIHISALTPQNETETHQGGRMPACVWHPDIEAKFIKILREKLTANGLSTEIWMFDHCFKSVERVDWSLEKIAGLKEACNGVAFHYYDGSIEQTAYLRKKYPEITLNFTEGGPRLYDNYATDWNKWFIMMAKVLKHGYSSFTGWNLMLDETGGPNIGPFFCGGLVTRDRVENCLKYSGQYKAFKHFAPFINRQTKIYPVSVNSFASMSSYPNLGKDVECIVWETDGIKYLGLANPNKDKRQVQINVGGEWWYIELLPDTVSTVKFEK